MYRVLMCAPGFAPYSASENLVNSKLALAMIRRGWDVTVISKVDEGFNYGAEWCEPWMELKPRAHCISYCHGSLTKRLGERISDLAKLRHPVAGIRWASKAADLAIRLHAEKPFDVVLSRAPSDNGHLPAMYLSKRLGIPWVANINDPPNHRWPEPYQSVHGSVRKWSAKRLMCHVVRQADRITFPCARLRDYVSDEFRDDVLSRARVVPHIGFVGYSPTPVAKADAFRMCHAGNMSGERQPAVFLDGFARFMATLADGEQCHLDVIGREDVGLMALAKRFGIARCITMTGALDYVGTLRRLGENHVLVVLEAPCREGIFLPSKVGDYAQVGRPILSVSPRVGTMADLLAEYGGGVVADCMSAAAVCEAMQRLYRAWKAGRLTTEYDTQRLFAIHAPGRILDQIEAIFNELGVYAECRVPPANL